MINKFSDLSTPFSRLKNIFEKSPISYETIGVVAAAGIVGCIGMVRYYSGYPEVLSKEICNRFALPEGTPGKYTVVESEEGSTEQLITYRFSLMTLSWEESKVLTGIIIRLRG